jgi:TonB family protein
MDHAMRRLVFLAVLMLAPAVMAQTVTMRVAVFEQAGQEKATPPDHVTSREWPSNLNELWDAIGTRGISLRRVDRFALAMKDHRDLDNVHVTLERVGGAKARVSVAVDGGGEPFSLPIPFNSTFVIATPDGAENPQWIAVSVFDDATAAKVPDVLRVGGEVKAPTATSHVNPLYPEAARAKHINGIVILETLIDANGNVTGAHILKPLPEGLDDAAATAVKQWRFQPATLEGQPVASIFNLTVQFKLR